MKNILIQRGTIKRPVIEHCHARFSDGVILDPNCRGISPEIMKTSLEFMEKHIYRYALQPLPTVTRQFGKNTFACRLFSPFDGKELDAYISTLEGLREGDIKAQDVTGFSKSDDRNQHMRKFDMYWDCTSHTVFSFDKNFMAAVNSMLYQSFCYMNRNKIVEGIQLEDLFDKVVG